MAKYSIPSSVDSLIGRIKDDLVPIGGEKYVVAFAKNERSLNERLTFQCEKVSLPGMSLTDIDYGLAAGNIRKMPMKRIFTNEISLSFRLSPTLRERTTFEDWINNIYDPVTNTLGFYKNYVDDMSVIVQDVDDSVIYGVLFEEVYPKEVSPIELGPKGDYLKQDVTFSYYRWKRIDSSVRGQEFSGNLDDSRKPWDNPAEAKADAGRVVLVDPTEFDNSTYPWRSPQSADSDGTTTISGHVGETGSSNIDSGGRVANGGAVLPGGGDTFLA